MGWSGVLMTFRYSLSCPRQVNTPVPLRKCIAKMLLLFLSRMFSNFLNTFSMAPTLRAFHPPSLGIPRLYSKTFARSPIQWMQVITRGFNIHLTLSSICWISPWHFFSSPNPPHNWSITAREKRSKLHLTSLPSVPIHSRHKVTEGPINNVMLFCLRCYPYLVSVVSV